MKSVQFFSINLVLILFNLSGQEDGLHSSKSLAVKIFNNWEGHLAAAICTGNFFTMNHTGRKLCAHLGEQDTQVANFATTFFRDACFGSATCLVGELARTRRQYVYSSKKRFAMKAGVVIGFATAFATSEMIENDKKRLKNRIPFHIQKKYDIRLPLTKKISEKSEAHKIYPSKQKCATTEAQKPCDSNLIVLLTAQNKQQTIAHSFLKIKKD